MPDNAAMGEYWNKVAGPRWVARAGLQEARNIEAAHLLQRAAAPQPGERVLDIGCGTGATAIPFAQAVAPSGHVTGIDISEPMLDQARENIAKAGVSNIALIRADAQAQRFPADSFDLLISRFGVMFFADPVAAFTNLFAGLRRGGRLCMAVWASMAENAHWKIPFDIAAKHLGEPASVDPHAPGPMAFRDPAYLRDILVKAGFAEIDIAPQGFKIIGLTAKSEAEHAAMFGPAWRLMEEKQAPESVRQAIVAETAAAYAPYLTRAGMRLPGTVLIAKAVKA
ncbi:MAG TPA: methyltransferase domain-containing protein [Stellaceae bacterium]|nr:methyltransferase domain-containing protein [Stellaceae bacterium]